jgi:hypothetical protein
MRGDRGVAAIVQVVVILLGIGLVLAAALSFDLNRFSALFYAGLGAILLSVGGIARISILGATVTGSAGLIMILLATFGPSVL